MTYIKNENININKTTMDIEWESLSKALPRMATATPSKNSYYMTPAFDEHRYTIEELAKEIVLEQKDYVFGQTLYSSPTLMTKSFKIRNRKLIIKKTPVHLNPKKTSYVKKTKLEKLAHKLMWKFK